MVGKLPSLPVRAGLAYARASLLMEAKRFILFLDSCTGNGSFSLGKKVRMRALNTEGE
jgi:hypothetical protein